MDFKNIQAQAQQFLSKIDAVSSSPNDNDNGTDTDNDNSNDYAPHCKRWKNRILTFPPLFLFLQSTQQCGVLSQFEAQTKLPRSYAVLAAGALYILLVFVNFGGIGQLLSNLAGFVLPAYYSLKALKTKTTSDDTKLLTYWVVFAGLQIVEFWSKTILYWIPAYFLFKTLFLVYIAIPSTNGAELVYNTVIVPLSNRFITVDPASDLLGKVQEKVE